MFKKLVKFALKIVGKKIGVEVGSRGMKTLSDSDIEKELIKADPFSGFILAKGAKGAVTRSIADEDSFVKGLEVEFEEEFASDLEIKQIFKEEAVGSKLLDLDKLAEDEDKKSRGIFSFALAVKYMASIGFRVIKRYLSQRDHDFYPTVVEEILREFYLAKFGAFFWNHMKQKSRQMWEPGFDNKQYAGTYFLEKLNNLVKQNPGTIIDLVGHSAGSIAICNMMKLIGSSSFKHIKIRNIIFLAPACTCKLFYEEIYQHPERFRSLLMFTMKDSCEKKDRLVPLLYPRSLLYLISGILEEEGKGADVEILGLERHITGKAPYDSGPLISIHNYFREKNRLVLSVTEGEQPPGYNSTSKKHGDFDNDPPTLQSIMDIIRKTR